MTGERKTRKVRQKGWNEGEERRGNEKNGKG